TTSQRESRTAPSVPNGPRWNRASSPAAFSVWAVRRPNDSSSSTTSILGILYPIAYELTRVRVGARDHSRRTSAIFLDAHDVDKANLELSGRISAREIHPCCTPCVAQEMRNKPCAR